MVGISGSLEIRQMAAYASGIGGGQIVVSLDVALLALKWDMRAGQGETCRRVIERRIGPGSCVVALLAGGREARLNVIGICGPGEIRLMAGITCRRR